MLNNGRAGRRVPTDSDRAAACTSSLSCEGARRIALTAAMLRAVLNEKRSRVNIMSLAAADRPGNKQTRTARREISHRRHSSIRSQYGSTCRATTGIQDDVASRTAPARVDSSKAIHIAGDV